MGMYTELLLKCQILDKEHENLPNSVDEVLNFLFNRADGMQVPVTHIRHKFFDCDRWQMIGAGSSYYHVPFAFSAYQEGYLFTRCDLKNYSNEIELFLDWLDPYIDALPGSVIGWQWYEEEDEPTILRKKGLNHANQTLHHP